MGGCLQQFGGGVRDLPCPPVAQFGTLSRQPTELPDATTPADRNLEELPGSRICPKIPYPGNASFVVWHLMAILNFEENVHILRNQLKRFEEQMPTMCSVFARAASPHINFITTEQVMYFWCHSVFNQSLRKPHTKSVISVFGIWEGMHGANGAGFRQGELASQAWASQPRPPPQFGVVVIDSCWRS